MIEVDGQIYAAREKVALYTCPEYCIDLFARAGEPNMDPEWAPTHLWRQYLMDDLDGVIEHLFMYLGRA